MSTNIGDIIFGTNSTLFQVLDTLDVPSLSAQIAALEERIDEVNYQLRQLGVIVDQNQIKNNTEFVNVNTRVDNLQAEVNALATLITGWDERIISVETEVNNLSVAVQQLSLTVTGFDARINEQGLELVRHQLRLQIIERDMPPILNANRPFVLSRMRNIQETAQITTTIVGSGVIMSHTTYTQDNGLEIRLAGGSDTPFDTPPVRYPIREGPVTYRWHQGSNVIDAYLYVLP